MSLFVCSNHIQRMGWGSIETIRVVAKDRVVGKAMIVVFQKFSFCVFVCKKIDQFLLCPQRHKWGFRIFLLVNCPFITSTTKGIWFPISLRCRLFVGFINSKSKCTHRWVFVELQGANNALRWYQEENMGHTLKKGHCS